MGKAEMKKYIVISLLLIVLVALGFGGYSRYRLQLVSSQPSQNGLQPYYQPVTMTFNADLKPDQKLVVKVTPNAPGAVSISGKTLTFSPESAFEVGQEYTLTVESLVGADGVNSLNSASLKFTGKFVEDKDLPESIRKNQPPDTEAPAEFQEDTPGQ